MVKNRFQDKTKPVAEQAASGSGRARATTATIGTRTPVNFEARHLTPYGGLLPVSILLEKIGFAELVEQYIGSARKTRVLSLYQFVMAMVLGLYLGFARFHQLQFVATDPLLNGILQVQRLPGQSTFWRFLAGLHGSVALRLVQLQQCLRGRVWSAARVSLQRITLDTDTTVHTLYGRPCQLRPEEKRRAQPSADSHLSGRDSRVRRRATAQRRSSHGPPDPAASATDLSRCARRRAPGTGARRFRILLLGHYRDLPSASLPIYCGGA